MALSRREALALLGLAGDPSDAEIEAAIHRRLLETHPDRGGTERDFSTVLEAREALSKRSGDQSTTLVPVEQSTMLPDIVEKREAVASQRERSAAVTSQLVRAQVTRLAANRQAANLVAYLGSGVTALGIAVRTLGSVTARQTWPPDLTLAAGIIAVGFAAVSFAIKGKIVTVEQAIENASETLADRAAFVDVVQELAYATRLEADRMLDVFTKLDSAGSDTGVASLRWQSAKALADAWVGADGELEWTRTQLVESVGVWATRNAANSFGRLGQSNYLPPLPVRLAVAYLRGARRLVQIFLGRIHQEPSMADLAFVVGREGFAKLLLAKGQEIELVTTEEYAHDRRLIVKYQLAMPGSSEAEPESTDGMPVS
jgi:uncharacterized membrane protein (DUF2068 family)